MATALQPVGASDICELFGGISLSPFPKVPTVTSPFLTIRDPAASWSAPLCERPAEVAGGYCYVRTSLNKVYHYCNCRHVTCAGAGVVWCSTPPRGWRLGHCCLGIDLPGGTMAAGVPMARVAKALRSRSAVRTATAVGAPTGTPAGTPASAVGAVVATVVADLCHPSPPTVFRHVEDDSKYHAVSECAAHSGTTPEALSVIGNRTLCGNCASIQAVARRMAPGKAPSRVHVLAHDTSPRPPYVVGMAYHVAGSNVAAVHGHPACAGLDKTNKPVLATMTAPLGRRACKVCGGPGSAEAARIETRRQGLAAGTASA